MNRSLLESARRVWSTMAATPDAFHDGRVHTVVQPDSQLAARGYVGVVALGDAAIVTVPDAATEAFVGRLIAGVAPALVPDFDWQSAGATRVVGPAALFYGVDAHDPKLHHVDEVPADDDALADLARRVPAEDAAESSIDEAESPVFVVRNAGVVLSACGRSRWPESIAHVSVLTDPSARRRGYARSAAVVAINRAATEGLVAQWRARPVASQRLATALGLTHLGAQACAHFD